MLSYRHLFVHCLDNMVASFCNGQLKFPVSVPVAELVCVDTDDTFSYDKAHIDTLSRVILIHPI